MIKRQIISQPKLCLVFKYLKDVFEFLSPESFRHHNDADESRHYFDYASSGGTEGGWEEIQMRSFKYIIFPMFWSESTVLKQIQTRHLSLISCRNGCFYEETNVPCSSFHACSCQQRSILHSWNLKQKA